MPELVEIVGAHRKGVDHPRSASGLLMTATLTPPASAVARSNPTERLRDYLGALEFNLSLPSRIVDRILFADNSGSDLAPLVALARATPHDKVVQLLSFEGNDHSPSLGKAYGEFKLMDHALATTRLFTDEDRIWKVTGRLRLVNLAEISDAVPKPYDLLCDLHNLPFVGSGRLLGNRYVDLRAFAFRRRAYDVLFRSTWSAHAGEFDAGWLFDRIVHVPPTLRVIPRFPRQPWLEGISGRHGRSYSSGSQYVKDRVRGIIRRLAPSVWL